MDLYPHGSAFIFPPGTGSGSAFSMRIRIQEGKFVHWKLKKCKEISNNRNFIRFLKSKFAQAPLFLTFYFMFLQLKKTPLFLTFEQYFMFLQLKKTLHNFFPSNLVKLDLDLDTDPDLDPDLHSEKCWIRIRIKWMRIHSPVLYLLCWSRFGNLDWD